MYNLINKINPDVDGVSKEELQLAFKYAASFVTGNLRFPESQINPQIKSQLEELTNEEVGAIKNWSRLEK